METKTHGGPGVEEHRELDKRIGKLLGWSMVKGSEWLAYHPFTGDTQRLPAWSTDEAWAASLLDEVHDVKMEKTGDLWKVEISEQVPVCADDKHGLDELTYTAYHEGKAGTLPEAIARAWLAYKSGWV